MRIGDVGEKFLAVHHCFETQAAQAADAIALEFAGKQFTYQTLNERANQLAHYLQTLELEPNARIGLCIERSPELIIAVLAILKTGAAYIPLDASYPVDRLAYMLDNAQVSVLLTQSQLVDTLPTQDRQVICVDVDRAAIATYSAQNLDVEITPNHLAYVIYTSGSTGQPKGVMMPHRALLNLIRWQRQNSITKAGRTLQFSPISFDVSFQEIFSTFAAGGTLVLIVEETRRDPQSLLRFLDDAAIERLFLPFVALQQLAEVAKVRGIVPQRLREVITAGEALRITDAIACWFTALTHCTLSNHYGPSESHVVTAYTLTGHPKTWSLLPPIGKPIPSTQIYLLDEQLQPVPFGAAGELYIGGVCLAQGYLNRPDLTGDRFIANPHAPKPDARLYKTGDLARYLPDGNLEYLGRIDQQVKIRGFRIEPGEVESVLEQHPTIREAIVAAKEDIPGDKRLVAYLVADDSRQLQTSTLKDLRQFLKSRLPEYMVPNHYVYVDRFPLTPSGKVDRLALSGCDRHQILTSPRGLDSELAPPTTDTEVLLAQIWGNVLALETVGVDDNFLELGGHSLLAVQVLARIHDALQIELPLRYLFEAPTIRELARVLDSAQHNTSAASSVLLKSVDRNCRLPLALVQEPLWFLDQLVSSHPFYNVPEVFRLTGQINVAALGQSLQEIVKRHEVVRSTFEIVEGKPVQIVHSAPDLSPLVVVDLRDSVHDQKEAEAWEWINKEAQLPFNLAKDLLLRATLYRLSDTESVLFLNQHHIVCDGWSISILLQELSLLYTAFAAGHDFPLPELSIQYGDFAVWHRQWLRDEVRSQQLDYWKQQLSGDLPILQLPSDRPRPLVPTYQGARHFLSLPYALTQALKDLSRQAGATLFMTLLAAFQALLSRYSGQTDISVGSLVANRQRSELEMMLGFFANTLVLRTDVSGSPSFRELLHRVQAVTLGAYFNQDVPFDEVVQAVQPDRTLTQNPLFQVLFNLQNTPTAGWTAPITLTRLELDNQTAKFDLFLELAETPEGLKGYFEYSTDLFDAATIARMAEHFQNLLEGAVANPDQQLISLGILTTTEQQQIEAWNDTYTEIPSLGVHQLFEAQVERTPDAIAVQYDGQRLTYRELNQHANQLAHHLQAIGVKPDTLVGLCLTRSLNLVVGLLGILKAGGAYVPIDPAYPAARIAFMLEDSQVAVLVTQRSLLETLPQLAAQVVCLDQWDAVTHDSSGHCSADNPVSEVAAEHLAYTIYTSGSTGQPKGVQISHRALTNLLHSMRQEPGLTAQDILLSVTTICFDIAALEIYLPLVVGACIVLASREATMDGKQLANLIEQSGATVMQATPATWRLLLTAGWQGNSQLKILCGGEALSRELADQLLVRSQSLWNMYGPTETTIWSAVHPVQPGDGPVALGRAIANTQLYLLDPQHLETGVNEPVPIGVSGELCIGGFGLAQGYLNRPELTQERFIPNPLRSPLFASNQVMQKIEDCEYLYRTGDLARYRPDGKIEYIGRVDHQVKIRGFRIELGDIEAAIHQHSAVRETVVVAREDTPGDQRLVAYVVVERSPNDQSLKQQERTQQWQKIWDAAYSQSVSGQDATFNIAGWNNSYTGALTATEEMREWVDHTVMRILSLQPQRVLEVGCGTGLLLFRIAPHCEHYVGIDQSDTAIGYLKQQLTSNERWSHVQLNNRAADTLDQLNSNAFDTVIINSVVQYFPSIEYLVKVLEQVIPQVKPDGSIFIGDVRSLTLLEAFHTSVQLYQASDTLAIADLQKRIRERVAHEGELLIDPTFFTALKQHLPTINRVEIQLKRGHHHNELTRFRYDVVLHIGPQSTSAPPPDVPSNGHTPTWQLWQPHLTVSAVRQILEATKPVCFRLSHVPNARLSTEIAAMEQLASNSELETVGMLRQALQNSPLDAGIDPEDWWQLEQTLPYRVLITWSVNQSDGSYDVEFQTVEFQRSRDRNLDVQPAISQPQVNSQPWRVYANTPFQGKQPNSLIPELQTLLRGSLPDYMIPSAFVILDTLPLTPNGKVDRQALPAPNREHTPSSSTLIAPRTPIEKQLSDIWAKVLGIAQVGVEDNFFELGGHSLLIAQMVAQVQASFDVELSLFSVFAAPTIQELAAVIGDRQSSSTDILFQTTLDLRAEAVLDSTIFPEGTLETPVHKPAHVLLTGATGFLGAFLLHELLEQTQATIYCLVRAETVEAGAQRLQQNLSSYSLCHPAQADRIVPVLGDLSLPLLGLSAEQFHTLATTLDSIYHSGGFVNFIYPYSALKAANVLSTEEVLRLAAQVKVKPVHFVSTLGVFSPIAYQDGQIIRQDQPEHPEGLYGYTQSKWVAEKLLAIAQTRGIPNTVYRPAWIEGHSQTGICNRSDFFRSLIKGCIQLGIAPDWRMPVDLAPIDYISRAIVHLSLQDTASGQAFNFSNPQTLSWHELVSWINQFGYPIHLIPYEQWIVKAREQIQHQSDNALHPFSTFLFEKVGGKQLTIPETYFQTNSIQFDCQTMIDQLSCLSPYPPVDDTLLTTYFQQFIRSGFLAPPPA